MIGNKHHLASALIYATTLALGVGLVALVRFDDKQNQRITQDSYLAESRAEFHEVAEKVEDVFKQVYQCLRTVARLPGVRELDPDAKNALQFHGGDGLERNTLQAIQEIYNNLGVNVAVSELYIVPADLDPDAPGSNTQAAREPLATFDHLILGRQGGAGTGEEDEPVEVEEIEIYEYRLMKKQLAWMKKQFPHEVDINALNYPMMGGPLVVTCDNSQYDPSAPDDKDRSGLILSIPYYGPDGELRGCVSAVILTHTLKTLLPSGSYAISSTEYDYCVTPHQDGQWQASYEYASAAREDPDLLVSLSHRLDVQNMGGAWSLWLGRPDSDFWDRSDVRATAKSRNLAYGFVTFILLTAIFGTWLAHRGRQAIIRVNRGLEQSIIAVKESESRYQLAVRGSQDGLWDWDLLSDQVIYAPQWKWMLGLEEAEVSDRPDEWISRIDHRDIEAFKHEFDKHMRGEDTVFEVELRMVHKAGHTVWMLCRGAVVRDEQGRAIRVAGSMADITEIKDAQGKLRKAAEHDRLTDLPNRELFKKHLEQAIHRAEFDTEFKFAVLFFDFDRFKVINDSLGHSVGDALLIDIASQFRRGLRKRDVAARFGGDEFVVLLRDLRDYDEAHQTADRLLTTFAKPHDLMGHSVTSTASVGLVNNAQGYTNAEDMIRDADAAMYQAKEAGKARVVVFDQVMHERALSRLKLEGDLRIALEGEQFRLVYQPIVELNTGEVSGFEALLRWDHPVHGTISPDEFIPIAEDTGLILSIGKWVLRTSARQLADWNHRLGLGCRLTVNVNISKRQLLTSSILDDALGCMREYQLQPGDLKLEVTESTIADDRSDVVPLLRLLRGHGFPIVMDDFGTGVSSLSSLHEFPIDVLKIDQSFIRVLDHDRSLLAVVASIALLAENLGILTVAEGIESKDIVGALQSIECTWGQGYHFARPMSPADAEAYLLGTCKKKRSA